MIEVRRRRLQLLETRWRLHHRFGEDDMANLLNLGYQIYENGILINDAEAERDPAKDFLVRWENLAIAARQAHDDKEGVDGELEDGTMKNVKVDWELLKAYYLKVNDVIYRRSGGMDTPVGND